MKKDINFLECQEAGIKKRSSSTMTLLLVMGVVAIVGVLLFMFLNNKMVIEDNDKQIKTLTAQSDTSILEQKRQEYEEKRIKYERIMQESVGSIYVNGISKDSVQLSKEIMDILYLYANGKDETAYTDDDVVRISQFSYTDGKITLTCLSRNARESENRYDSTAFIEYLKNIKFAPYFSDVEYMGWSVDHEQDEWATSFNLSIKLNGVSL